MYPSKTQENERKVGESGQRAGVGCSETLGKSMDLSGNIFREANNRIGPDAKHWNCYLWLLVTSRSRFYGPNRYGVLDAETVGPGS